MRDRGERTGSAHTKGMETMAGPILSSSAAPVSDPKQLVAVREAQPDGPNLERCRLQGQPVRRMPTLAGIPILILAAESSYHAIYDHGTSKYLAQAGVKNDFVRLEAVGIRGNGHMLMLEKNNLEIAAFIDQWVGQNVR